MRNFFAVVGIVGTVALVIGCGVIALLVGNLLLDVNRAPVVLETAVQTLAPISPAMAAEPGVIILTTSTPYLTAVPQATATAYPTQTPTATSEPAPTRPAIEQLPHGEGPYTVEQMQICRDVWAQSLQAELNIKQFGYCQGVVNR